MEGMCPLDLWNVSVFLEPFQYTLFTYPWNKFVTPYYGILNGTNTEPVEELSVLKRQKICLLCHHPLVTAA